MVREMNETAGERVEWPGELVIWSGKLVVCLEKRELYKFNEKEMPNSARKWLFA